MIPCKNIFCIECGKIYAYKCAYNWTQECFAEKCEKKHLFDLSCYGGASREDDEKTNLKAACPSCKYNYPKDQLKYSSECRRHAPSDKGYPTVWYNELCGDYIRKDKK